jgi:hypothetical protein
MRALVLLLALLMAAAPAEAQRVCQKVGQTVQCSDGATLPRTQSPKAQPPKDGTFEYFPNGTVCQVFGKQRYCK